MASDEELQFLEMEGKRGLVRLHCGLEGTDALIADLARALDSI